MKRYIAVLEIEDDEDIVGSIEATASYTYRKNGTNYGTDENVEFKADDEGQRMKAYEDGLNEAWEAARKIACGDGYSCGRPSDIFGNCSASYIFDHFTASEAIDAIEKYEKIKVGDEVIDSNSMSEKKSVVVQVNGTVITIMEDDGTAIRTGIRGFKKTGRHFPQIEEVLKQMRE